MPLYEYKCLKCGRHTEKIEPVGGPHLKKCPHCGGKVESVITAPAIKFKGSGWYVTDYAGKSPDGGSKESKPASDGKEASGKECRRERRRRQRWRSRGRSKDSAGKETSFQRELFKRKEALEEKISGESKRMADIPLQTGARRKVRKAVLPAAGLGTRFLPATKAQPKEMLTVVDKPQIQYVVEECVASGIEHIIIVTGKGKNSIEDHFDHAPTLERFLEEKGKKEQAAMVRRISDMVQVSYTRQKEPLGLGHAVLVAEDLGWRRTVRGFAWGCADSGKNPATKQLIDVYAATGVGAIAVEEVPREKTHLVWNRRRRTRAAAALWRAAVANSRLGGETETGECAVKPGDHWAIRFAATNFRLLEAHQAGRGK